MDYSLLFFFNAIIQPAIHFMRLLMEPNHMFFFFCSQVSEEVIMMIQTPEYDSNSTDVIWCKHRTNGKFMFAPGQTVEIMAELTDAAFVTIGHDQITASFFSNGFSVSAPPPGARRGWNRCYQQGCFYPLSQSNILLPLAW